MLQSLYLVSFNRCSVSVSYVPASILDAEDPAVNTTHSLWTGGRGSTWSQIIEALGRRGTGLRKFPQEALYFTGVRQ